MIPMVKYWGVQSTIMSDHDAQFIRQFGMELFKDVVHGLKIVYEFAHLKR